MAYTKLANSILTSTVWMEGDRTRIVWFALMAMADRNGEVQASIPGLANIARVPVEDCRKAIQTFLSPDPDSRTKDDEGRRLMEVDGGWYLINHPKYRKLASDEDRREKAAIRQARWRDNNASNAPVTPPLRQKSQAEAEAEAEADQIHSSALCAERLRLAKLFNRRPTTTWSEKEVKLWKAITPIDSDDLGSVEKFFATPGSFHRKDLQTLLANWTLEVDRSKQPNTTNGTNQSNRNEGIVGHEPGKAERILAARAERDRAAKQSAQLTLATKVAGNGSNLVGGPRTS